MFKKEITDKLSRYFRLNQFEAEKIYDDLFKIIINAVNEDNVAEIENLGEFITRQDKNPTDSSVTRIVEFLPDTRLTDDLNVLFASVMGTASEHTEIKEVSGSVQQSNVESEILKKREEILKKISSPESETRVASDVTETLNSGESTTQVTETITDNNSDVQDSPVNTVQINLLDELQKESEKSFADLFSEVSDNTSQKNSGIREEGESRSTSLGNVLPQSVVDLHNEITGVKDDNSRQSVNTEPQSNGNGYEHKNPDNSYYIWYRDSEPNQTDTQTMSYEYELLYQATKEAEYKSKLRVYVTSFILFFSIVLLLLIFSPLIYKYFFSIPEQTEEVYEESGEIFEPSVNINKATLNVLEDNTEKLSTTTSSDATDKNPNITGSNSSPDKPGELSTQNTGQVSGNVTERNPTNENNARGIEGVVRNSMGWMDEKNKVIYVQLENGKFTIQESAWDSDIKANKRVNTISSVVPGLKGNVVKADLGAKGTWYRARFGEFSSLEEAKLKAEELRAKEKIKLHTYFISFLFFT